MPSTRRRTLLIVLLALVLAAAGTALIRLELSQDLPRDLDGRAVQVADGAAPTADIANAMQVVTDGPHRLSVPAAGLDVPLHSLLEVNGHITPPGFTAAYWVRNRGIDPATEPEAGTAYIATHAVSGGRAPGNLLYDMATGSMRVAAGDEIRVGPTVYRIESWRTVPKAELAIDGDLWQNQPGRLVLITCLPRVGGLAEQNIVLVGWRR